MVTVNSDGRWSHWIRRGGDIEKDDYLGSGTVTIDKSTRGQNSIRVIALGGRGWLFVNGKYVSQLKLDDSSSQGDVAIVTGATKGNEMEGASTPYRDFEVRELDLKSGPLDGSIVGREGRITEHKAWVDVDDLIVEAQFTTHTQHR